MAQAQRKAHKLTPIKSSEMGRKVIYFDTESRLNEEHEHTPYLLCATFARYDLVKPYTDRVYIEDPELNKTTPHLNRFWDDVDQFTHKGEAVTVYSHNAFYDMVISQAIPALNAKGYKVMSFFEKGLTFFMKMQLIEDKKVRKTLDFISTTNYFSTSLGKLADTFGFPEKMEYDYDNGTIEEAIPYCKRDVEIIKLAMEKFRGMIKEEDLGPLKPTIAGQAFACYRHGFMDAEILIHNNDAATDLERAAYYGGRVECFKIGSFEGDFYKLDVNSMYPYVMHEFEYPVKLISYRKRGNLENLKKLLTRGLGVIAKVRIRTNKPNLPFRSAKKLVFPIGEFDVSLATPELKYCIENNFIVEVYEVAVYEMAKIFVNYIDYFYTKRQAAKAAGNGVYSNMYKLFLNSLYGKFGQRSESWERVGDAPADQVQVLTVQDPDGTQNTYKIFGGSIFKRVDEAESFNSFCAIATHVTSYARMLLAGFMEIAGRSELYYCDTDSLFTTKLGHDRLNAAGKLHNKELGKLKLEETGTSMEIHAPKDYRFNTTVKIKGVKKDAVMLPPDPDGLLKFEGLQWPRLNGMLHKGQLKQYQNARIVKKLARTYNGGMITTSGTVEPYTVEGGTLQDPMDQLKQLEKDLIQIENEQNKIIKNFKLQDKKFKNLKEDDLFKRIRELGKIAPTRTGAYAEEYRFSVPRSLKRKAGRPLDELADELNLTVKDLLDLLSPRYQQQISPELAATKTLEYQGLEKTRLNLISERDRILNFMTKYSIKF